MKHWLIILLFFCTLESAGQPASTLRFQRLSIEDGLPDATITCMLQDDDGFLWIGTDNGLSRYDGAEFKNFFHQASKNSLPGNTVKNIVKYDSNHLIVATTTGLSLLNIHTLQFKNLIVSAKAFMFNVENYFFNVAVDNKKNIWAGTKTTLYYLDRQFKLLRTIKGFREKDYNLKRMFFVAQIKILPNNIVTAHLQNKSWGGEFFVIDSSLVSLGSLKTGNDPLMKQLAEIFMGHFLLRDKDIVYVDPQSDNIIKLNFASLNKEFIRFPEINKDYRSLKSFSLEYLDEYLFIAKPQQGGFFLFPYPSQKSPQKVTLHLKDEVVTTVMKDREGNMWVGTQNGLFKSVVTSERVLSKFINQSTYDPGLFPSLRKIFFFNQEIWISTNTSGFVIMDRSLSSYNNILLKEGEHVNMTWNIQPIAADTIWLNSQNGVRWYSLKNKSSGKLLFPHPSVLDIDPVTVSYRDSKGLIWLGVGFGNGVIRFDPTNHTFRHFLPSDPVNPIPIRYPIAIAEDQNGDLWMGNQDGNGLARWVRSTGKFEFISPVYGEAFDNASINTIFFDKKESLWIGTSNGLFSYHIPTKIFRRFDITNGLLSSYINSICDDKKGRLWIGSNYGLSCFVKESDRFINFTRNDALPESSILDLAFDSVTQKIFFTTSRHVGSFYPDSLLSLQSQLIIKVTGIQVGNFQDFQQKYSIPYNENDVSINFTAVNLTDGQKNHYFYRMNNKEWISTGGRRSLHFTNLSPGTYTIDLKASNSSGKESMYSAALVFTIHPPFWQTWWFYTACAVSVALIFYALYRYRVKQLIKWQNARDRIATDLHDDIGSTLTNISILSQLSSKNLDKPAEAERFLQRISDEVHNSSQAMDDIIWSVNSRNDSMEETMARMRRYVADVFENTPIKTHIDLEENDTSRKLGMQQRRDIFLIYKESLNNIIKHAEANNVWITARQNNDMLHLKIRDDGNGFNDGAPSHRNGLKNIRERVKKWNGKIKVISTPGNGTLIQVDMPVEN